MHDFLKDFLDSKILGRFPFMKRLERNPKVLGRFPFMKRLGSGFQHSVNIPLHGTPGDYELQDAPLFLSDPLVDGQRKCKISMDAQK